jgi:hypothetical protein
MEATCSADGSVPRHKMAIIEIGAVMESARTFEVESEFQSFVCPVRHPELTEFCTESGRRPKVSRPSGDRKDSSKGWYLPGEFDGLVRRVR